MQLCPGVSAPTLAEMQQGACVHWLGPKHSHCSSVGGLQPVVLQDCVDPKHAEPGLHKDGHGFGANVHTGKPESPESTPPSLVVDASPALASVGPQRALPFTTLHASPELHVPFAKHGPLSVPCAEVSVLTQARTRELMTSEPMAKLLDIRPG